MVQSIEQGGFQVQADAPLRIALRQHPRRGQRVGQVPQFGLDAGLVHIEPAIVRIQPDRLVEPFERRGGLAVDRLQLAQEVPDVGIGRIALRQGFGDALRLRRVCLLYTSRCV